MLVTSKEIFTAAQKGHYAVPAANFINLDMMKWHVQTAERLQKPLIIALAESHFPYGLTLEEAAVMGKFYAEHASVPIVLHLDHGESFETCKKVVDLGFTSVMIDYSMKPLEENIALSKKVIDYAHARGVVVESEIGHVGSNVNTDDDSKYTTVEEAETFINGTGTDSLAISIGTAHGFYKGTPKINFERLAEIAAAVDTPLVLHGGSSSGDDNLNRCATGGIAKVNIYSDFLGGAKKAFDEQKPDQYIGMINAAKAGMQATLEHYYSVFETPSV